MGGRSPLLRLQSDERLVALIRRGHPGAFEALVQRYQARLHAFCRHMLGSKEDAEDVLQEVFASAYNAILADDRPINARPWLYRIARNRSLNHMRRPAHAGQDSMDVYERAGGETAADAVHRREDFRLLIADVGKLPESQRTALLMREIDALSYEQIAEAMDTTVPSVKSLLVRARVGLAEAAQARMLSCEEVRLSLAEAVEGVARLSAPVRRHLKACERCRGFRSELRRTTRALAALYPVGPLVVAQKLLLGKLGGAGGGSGAGASAGGSSVIGGSTVAGGSAWGGAAGGSALGGSVLGGGTGGLLSTGVGAIATKAAAGLVAAAVVTAGAVEIRHLTTSPPATVRPSVQSADPPGDHGQHPPGQPDPTAAVAVGPVSHTALLAEPKTAPTQSDAGPQESDPSASAGGSATGTPSATPTAAPSHASDGAAPVSTTSDAAGGNGAPTDGTGGAGDGGSVEAKAPEGGGGGQTGGDGGGPSPAPAPAGDPVGSSELPAPAPPAVGEARDSGF